MSSSANNSGSQSETAVVTYGPEEFAEFLARNKVIPLSLMTIHSLEGNNVKREGKLVWADGFMDLVPVRPLRPETVNRRLRGSLTYKQSEKFLNRSDSMYDRVSVGGVAIQDNGMQILHGAIGIGVVKQAARFLDSALLVETNEGDGRYVKKIEMRYKQTGPDQDGQMDMDCLRESIDSFPDETLVGIYLWVNPTDDGWLRLNLVLNKWDQNKVLSLPRFNLEFREVGGIPTLNLEDFGFTF